MGVVTIGTTMPASRPGPLASPAVVSPASNSTLPWCYVVNVNGTDSTNSTLSPPAVGLSLTNAPLPSALPGQTNATNATTVLFNSTVICVLHPVTHTTTPSTNLTPTSGSSPRASHHALNISETELTKTSMVSTTSSRHPVSSKSSGVLVTSSSRVVVVTPSSRPVTSSAPGTPDCSPPTLVKSSSSSASPRTSSRPTVVKPNPPLPPVTAPAHTTTWPSESSPTASRAPKSPNTVPPARPAVPSSASVSSRTSSRSAVTVPNLPLPSFPAPAHTTTLPSESFPTPPGVPKLPDIVSPPLLAVPSGASGLSPVAPFSLASLTGFSTGLDILQSTHSTITSTVTDAPESTFSTPVSITETTDSHVTITAPPLITTSGLSTLPDGTVVTVTHVIANPPRQDVSGSSSGDSFFGNHAAVVGVFLASGFTVAGLALLLFCCFRRRQRRAQRRGTRLPEISHPRPIQNPFSDVTGNPATREQAAPNVRWHGFMGPRDPASVSQSSISLSLNRSEDSPPAAHGAPVPSPPVERAPSRSSRSSYRVPVPYAGIGAHGNDMRAVNRHSTGAPSEHLQIQIAPPSNVPPRLPPRSPLRLLAVRNFAKIPRENALNLSLSRASSPSVYPPSLRRSSADVDTDSLYPKEVVANLPSSSLKRESSGWLTRTPSGTKSGQEHKVGRVDGNAESQGALISPVDSDGTRSFTVSASSSSHAHYSPLESPASEAGTALTSIQDGSVHNRKVALPRVPPAALFTHQVENRKSGARLRRAS